MSIDFKMKVSREVLENIRKENPKLAEIIEADSKCFLVEKAQKQ